MWRALAYLIVPFLTLAALGGAALGGWAILEGRYKSAGAAFFWVALWSWGAVRTYQREIREPREEKKKLCASVTRQLAEILRPGLVLKDGIHEVSVKFPVIGSPRFRDSVDLQFDTAVELESKGFTIWLFGKDEALKTWEVT